MVETSPAPSRAAAARDPLLAAKMAVPRVRSPVLLRRRLLDELSRGVAGPLTVMIAPAGAGKSVLASSWAVAGVAPGPVAWLTLDVHDDDSGAFWAYVVATLRRGGVALPDSVGEPIRADDVDHAFLVRLAGALAAQPGPVVLVLDEFEHVTRPAVLRDLEFLVRRATPVLRLVLLTRTGAFPALPRYQLSGDAVVIDAADLAFTPEEAARLLRQHGVHLSRSALASLTEQTAGWAAGLRLSAVAMQRRVDPDAFVAAMPTVDTALAGYLTEEVLNTQSTEIRRFLLDTSVAGRLCPALADALTGRIDSDTVLAALQTGNVLIEALPDAATWYRYHPLFAHVLRAELRRNHPERVAELHRRASRWFHDAGLLVEAVRHAVAAEDWQSAAAVVVRSMAIGRLLAGREAGALDALFAGLPPDEPGAMCDLVRAVRALTRSDVDGCRASLKVAESRAADEAGEDRAAVLASSAVIRAVVARALGRVDAAEAARHDAEQQLARLPERDGAHPDMRALLLSSVGSAQLWAGRVDDAERTLREGLAISGQPGCESPHLHILGRLAFVEYRKGRLGRAAELGREALEGAETHGLPVRHQTGAGHLALAIVALERDERPAAHHHLEAAEKTIGTQRDPFVATVAPMLRAWHFVGGRDFRRAFAALDRIPQAVDGAPVPEWLVARAALARAAVHLYRGDVSAATAVLDSVTLRGAEWQVARAGAAAAGGDRALARELLSPVLSGELPEVAVSTVEGWLLSARLHLDEGNRFAARDALTHALDRAGPERRRRPFGQAGPWLVEFLRSVPGLAAEHRWLGPPLVGATVRDRADALQADPFPPPVEQLTERERTVLVGLAHGMSTEDVATELVLSVNTVKTHQRSLYRKLAVNRRNDAVRRARELGLL